MDTVGSDQNLHGRDWSRLDYDLADNIFRRYLPFPDLLRCRYVCRSWRSVSCSLVSSTLNSPVLVLRRRYLPEHVTYSNEESCHLFFENNYFFWAEFCCFFNPVACELYPLSDKSKQLLKGRSLLGSSKGWALFEGAVDLLLFNAPTGIYIRLPSSVLHSKRIKKAVLWGGDPILDTKKKNNSLGIVGIQDIYPTIISFAVIWGDKKFNYTLHGLYHYDVVYFNGLVYAVFGKGFIQAWDSNQVIGSFGGYTPTKVEDYLPSFNPGKELALGHELRLVDSSGELWLVSKLGFQTQSKIVVYKLDFKERKWVDMDSLGHRVVFLCKNQSIAFSPFSPSKYKSDCVYFEDSDGSTSMNRCIYVYNLGDGSIAKSLW